MKFTITKSNLLESLKKVSVGIKSAQNRFLLSLEITGEELNLCYMDLDVKNWVVEENIAVSSEGGCSIDFTNLNNIVSSLKDDEIVFELVKNSLFIMQAETKFQIDVREETADLINIEEYSKEIPFSFSEFKNIVEKVNIIGEYRVGFNITSKAGILDIAMIDGRRLNLYTDDTNLEDFSYTFNPELFKTISKIKIEEDIKILIGKNKYYIKVVNLISEASLIDSMFPNVRMVIPEEFNTFVKVNVKEFKEKIKQIKPISDRNFKTTFEVRKERFYIENIRDNNAANTEIKDFILTGDEVKFALNYTFLLDVLEKIESEYVEMKMIDSDKAIVLQENEQFIYILMPMRV